MSIDFSLTAQQERLRRRARVFAEERIRPVAPHYDEAQEFPLPVIEEADAAGLTPRFFLPEEYGGGGLDPVSHMVVAEELHWGCAGVAISIMASHLAALAILVMGTEEQRKHWLARLCDPDRVTLGSTAWTEPRGGSDLMAIETRAERVDGGYVLNGQKYFITNGGIADVQVVFASTDGSGTASGLAAFVLDGDTPGFTLRRKFSKLGARAAHAGELAFEDCFVPLDARLGGEPRERGGVPGALGGMLMLERSRALIAAGAVGIAQAAYEYALDHARARRAFGQRIIDHQAIGFKLADMATQIEAARLLTWRAGWLAQRGLPGRRGEASMAKLFASDVVMQVTLDAVQILGGYGYIKDFPAEKWMRDAKVYQIWEGTSEIQRLLIVRAISAERAAAEALRATMTDNEGSVPTP
jgi:acyl-CoA dehydrogenase